MPTTSGPHLFGIAHVCGLAFVGGLLLGGWAGWAVAVVGLFLLGLSFDPPLGPVASFEATRVVRRQRLTLFRTIYGIGLLVLMIIVASSSLRVEWTTLLSFGSTYHVDRSRMAKFAESFFNAMLIAQFVVVLLFAPLMVAGCIAEEREKRTLDFVLTSDLSGREIVLGKLIARMGGFALIALVALPMFSLLPLLGGVEPIMICASFAAIAATLLSVSGLAIFFSIQTKKASHAIGPTFLIMCTPALWGYFALSVSELLSEKHPSSTTRALVTIGQKINIGNPIWVVEQIWSAGSPGQIVELWEPYVRFHLIAAFCFIATASSQLRAASRKLADRDSSSTGEATAPEERLGTVHSRPPMSDRPLLWKAMHAESDTFSDVSRLFFPRFSPLVIVMALTIGMWLLVLYFISMTPSRRMLQNINSSVESVYLAVFGLTFFHVAWLSASGIGRERDRRTLDDLLTTDLQRSEILWQLGLGSIAKHRLVGSWLIVNLVVSVFIGRLHPISCCLLIGVGCLYLVFATVLGLWMSVFSTTPGRACLRTSLIGLGLCFGPLFLILCDGSSTIIKLTLVFSPIIGLEFFDDYDKLNGRVAVVSIVIHILLYFVVIICMWLAAVQKFQTHRVSIQ